MTIQLNPSPTPDADGSTGLRGLLNSAAQTIAGLKSFAASVGAAVGIAFFNSVNQIIKIMPPSTVSGQSFADPTMWFQLSALNQTNLIQFGSGLTSTTWEFCLGWYGSAGAPYIGSRAGPILIGLASGSSVSPIAPDVNDLGSTGNYWRRVVASQGLLVPGTITDQSGTPATSGTINAPKGRCSLLSGNATFTLTNSLITANSVVIIEWEDDPGQRHRVVPGAGSVVITTSAAVAASSKFRFFVVG